MKNKLIFIPLLFTSLLSACVLYNGKEPVKNDSVITAVSTSVSSLEFNKGGLAKSVTATLVGDGEFDESLDVTVKDDTVVSITGTDGKFTSGVKFDVTPLTPGSTEIIITSVENRKISTKVAVTVSDVAATIPVSEVTLNKANLELIIGNNETLIHTVAPANATNKNVTWSSSDTSVATVDQTGKVIAVAKGTAIVKVTSEDGQKSAECSVSVIKNPAITEGYYLVGTMTNWKANADYKMEANPNNADEMMITWDGHLNDEVKVMYKPAAGADDWKQINAGESGSTGNCAEIVYEDGGNSNFKLKANAKFTLYFVKTAIEGSYKYWFTSSLV